MIILTVDPRSVDLTVGYIERVKQLIFSKMREGMKEGMEGLAGETVAAAGAAGIEARSGQLFTDILKSPKVTESAAQITGQVSAESEMTSGGRKFKGYLGTALDEGFHVRALKPDKTSGPFQFTAADGQTFYARGHKAFDVKPHPFLHQAQQAFSAPIVEIIRARVAEATE